MLGKLRVNVLSVNSCASLTHDARCRTRCRTEVQTTGSQLSHPSMDRDWIEGVLIRDQMEGEISKIIDVEVKPAAKTGDNYSSDISRIKVTAVLRSGRKICRRLIVKEVIQTQKEVFKDIPMFKTEIKLYRDVVSQMQDLMEEFQERNEKLWCHMYGFKPYNTIVLEDLTAENYVVANRTNCLDLNHALLVLKSIGRFHAMSKILMTRGTLGDDDLAPFYATTMHPLTKSFYEGSLMQLSNCVLSSWGSEWKSLAEKLKAEVKFICEKTKRLTETTDDMFIVANHGDLWTCNMMFKYSSNNNYPISVRFVDYQTCHLNSYIWDVVHFIYSSVVPKLRRENFDRLLEAYHGSLSESLLFYGFDGKIPSMEDVKSEVKRIEYYTFVVMTCIYPITSSEVKDALIMENLKPAEGGESMDAINPAIMGSERFKSNAQEDFAHFLKSGII